MFSSLYSFFITQPRYLVECLYISIAQDLDRRVLIDDFIIHLAILTTNSNSNTDKQQQQHQQRLKTILFRIYDIKLTNKLDRNIIEKILYKVYDINNTTPTTPTTASTTAPTTTTTTNNNNGNNNTAIQINQFLNNLYSKSTTSLLTPREFDAYTGDLTLMLSWLVVIINTIIQPLSPYLLLSEQKYSESIEINYILTYYNINDKLYIHIKNTFNVICTDSPRPEMNIYIWLELTKSYISQPLSYIIFYNKIKTIRYIWRFLEFLEFCVIFGHTPGGTAGGGSERGSGVGGKVDYLLDIFQKESKKLLKNTNTTSSNKDNNIVRSLTYTTNNTNNNSNSDTFSGSTIKIVAYKSHMQRMFRMLSFPESDFTPTTGIHIYYALYICADMYICLSYIHIHCYQYILYIYIHHI